MRDSKTSKDLYRLFQKAVPDTPIKRMGIPIKERAFFRGESLTPIQISLVASKTLDVAVFMGTVLYLVLLYQLSLWWASQTMFLKTLKRD
jgi:hypothetical protein